MNYRLGGLSKATSLLGNILAGIMLLQLTHTQMSLSRPSLSQASHVHGQTSNSVPTLSGYRAPHLSNVKTGVSVTPWTLSNMDS